MTRKLTPYTLPNGVEAALRPVSPEVLQKIYEANPPPPPPVEEVERPDGSVETRANPSDPEYQKAVSRHNGMMSFKLRDYIIARSLVLRLTDEMRDEVAQERAALAELNVKLPDNDLVVYFVHIACAGDLAASIEIIRAATQQMTATDPKSTGGSDDLTSDSPASQ